MVIKIKKLKKRFRKIRKIGKFWITLFYFKRNCNLCYDTLESDFEVFYDEEEKFRNSYENYRHIGDEFY